MTDSAQHWYLIDGMPIDNINDPKFVPTGAGGSVRRGITRSRKALGRRDGQEPHYEFSFTRDVVEGTQDFDFWAMMRNKTQFLFTEVSDYQTINYLSCQVLNIEGDVDGDGNKVETVSGNCLDMDGPF